MKCFQVDGMVVQDGIGVVASPYPHVVLGEGGNKRATWVALGKRDASGLVQDGRVHDAGAIALRDKNTGEPDGRFLIVAPRGSDDRAMVLWSVSSGYRGDARIEVERSAKILASDSAWHSGRGSLGENAEVLAIVEPGGSLLANITGRRVQDDRARLTWDGARVLITFFPFDADPMENGDGGDYV